MRTRRGTTVFEAMAALTLLAAGLAATAQMLTLSARQRHGVDRRIAAQLEAVNVVERLTAMPYGAVTPEALRAIELSPEAQAALPGGGLRVELAEEDAPPKHKRVAVEVAWPVQGGVDRQSVRLTTWKYARPEKAQ